MAAPQVQKPRLLDCMCGAGGCAEGYSQAGLQVVGIDIADQPNYPFEFHKADALEVLAALVAGEEWNGYGLADFACIHASPPCQNRSALKSLWQDREHPELIAPTRELLIAAGLPYVIENVERARPVLIEPTLDEYESHMCIPYAVAEETNGGDFRCRDLTRINEREGDGDAAKQQLREKGRDDG